MNGWDFLEEYDKLPEEQKARRIVVMLSTSLNPDDKIKAFGEEHVGEFLGKPLRKDELEKILKRFFRRISEGRWHRALC